MNKSYYWTLIFTILLFTRLCNATEIYYWQDTQGRRHYSDKQHKRATEYKLRRDYSFYTVEKVYDGDTVKISDGRKIRLLGINTPEIEHAHQAEQEGGERAKQWLTDLLLNNRIRLEYDQEKYDKYKRVLAHVFTEQGIHINRELVRRGYASANIYPPNLKYVDDLLLAEDLAEADKLDIWRYLAYQPKLTDTLNKHNKRGWQRIRGRVSYLSSTRKNYYVRLDENFYIRINKAYAQYFTDLGQLLDRQVEVRGWINRYKNSFAMSIRHPGALIIMD